MLQQSSREPDVGTIKPPPPPNPEMSLIENNLEIIALEDVGDGVFTNTRPLYKPPDSRGIYGGCLTWHSELKAIAQSLAAAQKTVPEEMSIHSIHCYFLVPGNSSIPVIYHVERVHSGRTFATRSVHARQRGQTIFTATCSFTRNVSGEKRTVEHALLFPKGVPAPDECLTEMQMIEKRLGKRLVTPEFAQMVRKLTETDPFQFRYAGILNDTLDAQPTEKLQRYWVRAKGAISKQDAHIPAMAYVSDSRLIATAARVNPRARTEQIGMILSLDHTIYFHQVPETRADRWLLVESDSPWAGGERALVAQRIWDPELGLLATCYQEGLIRLKDGTEGASRNPGVVGSKNWKL